MKTTQEYQKRLQRHLDELKWLYCELYPGREDMFGMMLYIDTFAGNLKGVKKKLPQAKDPARIDLEAYSGDERLVSSMIIPIRMIRCRPCGGFPMHVSVGSWKRKEQKRALSRTVF